LAADVKHDRLDSMGSDQSAKTGLQQQHQQMLGNLRPTGVSEEQQRYGSNSRGVKEQVGEVKQWSR
jgi:hypothetical protein